MKYAFNHFIAFQTIQDYSVSKYSLFPGHINMVLSTMETLKKYGD